MEGKLQKRVQRYGWDLAADAYEPLWARQLEPAREGLLQATPPRPGEEVLDIACGTGLITLTVAEAVGPDGHVLGVDISGGMVEQARAWAKRRGLVNATFQRMDAETLDLPDATFDLALNALGLMYDPDPERALAEMRRVVRPGGRMGAVVWGERSRCGWSPVFEIVDAEVRSDVCPLFFRLGRANILAELCEAAGFVGVEIRRIPTTLDYGCAEEACDAALIGGPVAMAWSRFDAAARKRARARYVEAIAPWKTSSGYALPGEFVVVAALVPG